MLNGKNILAVIMARDGSRGLPGKNYRSLAGKPLFLWSVIAAQKSKYIDKIVTTSCNKNVEELWAEYFYGEGQQDERLLFAKRPAELNGPLVKNEPVVQHAYKKGAQFYKYGNKFDYVVMLQPTSPFRYDDLLDNCIEYIDRNNADSLLTVTKNTPFIWNKKDNKWICPNNYYKDRPMRQELKEEDFILHDNGNIYITRTEILFDKNNRLGGKVVGYEIDKFQSLQIDDLDDFILIDQVYKVINKVV